VGEVVLVIDDNADIREMVCLVLEGDGYEVAGVSNGKEAIDWLHAEAAPSVVLLDLTMPVMDGYQFLRAKAADPGLVDVPVIVLTAVTGFRPLPLDQQVRECLPKPFSTRALLDAVERSAGWV
jgi:CheY-like chemotaxis protein